MYKVCFMFGSSTAKYDVLPALEAAVQRHYLDYGISSFMVGSRGTFDQMAATAVKRLKKKHPHISLQLLLAYHPAERTVDLGAGFDGSFYPPLEGVPRKFAIVRANQYMIDRADSIICYANSIGNSRNFLEYAQRRTRIPIENIAQP